VAAVAVVLGAVVATEADLVVETVALAVRL
jgi:hypothetical protein